MCSQRIFAFASLIVCSTAVHAASLTPEEAAGHVGENATVCGVVASATYAAQSPAAPTFLNFGKPYPNQIFTAVILGSDRKKFGTPEIALRDKPVCVTGKIFLYQGAPEIALRDPTQLSEK
jgi:micrococcal nuclease